MGFPRFRFTLNNTIAGSLRISEPGGWDDAKMQLERNQVFHSLVEFYDQPLLFYGQSSEGNGGLDYIRAIEKSQGPDAQITILIEISHDDGITYPDTVFDGLIDIPSAKEIDFYKAEYGILRDDFWQKFINRKATPVNLGASTDLDGGSVSVYSPDTITLTSQKIRSGFTRTTNYASSSADFQFIDNYSMSGTQYLIFDNTRVDLDEVLERFEYGLQITTGLPTDDLKYFFKVTFPGSYQFNATVRFKIFFYLFGGVTYDLRWYVAVRHAGALTVTQFGTSIIGGPGNDIVGSKVLSTTFSLTEGDEVYIYGTLVVGAATPMSYQCDYDDTSPGFTPVYTELTVTADTTYPSTTVSTYQIHDAANSIVSKLVGVNTPVASDYLSGDYGCAGNYTLTKGLYIRGYAIADKPFFMSFDQWWAGANPILNLGLGYIDNAGIEIEQKSEFYDRVPVLNFDFVNLIERGWDSKSIFKTVEVGYEKWAAESASGIDDPQSKRTFHTRFKTIGDDLKILSKFYAASLGIEQTRRNRVELGRDWRLDEDIFIIATKKLNSTLPEIGSDFLSVSGLLNSTTRYNIRISATRNLNRWLSFINGCLKWYTTDDDLSFAGGEGNFDMQSNLLTTDCEANGFAVDENADIDQGAGHDFLFVPVVYEFEHPLTWEEYKAIRDYRKKAIGVSRGNSGHAPCFIMNLEYHLTRGKANFTVMLGQSTQI